MAVCQASTGHLCVEMLEWSGHHSGHQGLCQALLRPMLALYSSMWPAQDISSLALPQRLPEALVSTAWRCLLRALICLSAACHSQMKMLLLLTMLCMTRTVIHTSKGQMGSLQKSGTSQYLSLAWMGALMRMRIQHTMRLPLGSLEHPGHT